MLTQNIYEPQEDTIMLLGHIKKYAHGNVLDMGCGSGILSFEAAKYAKKVTGVDINKNAVIHCYIKKKANKVNNATFFESNLFENIHEKYDLIIFNPPYLPADTTAPDVALDGGKRGYEVILKFLSQVNNYLNENGKVLIVFSSLTNKKKIDEELAKNLFEYKELERKKIPFEELYVYLIKRGPILNKMFKKVSNIEYFCKGKRGVLYKALLTTGKNKGKEVIIKIQNSETKAENVVENEAKYLEIVNKKGIGPKLFEASNNKYLIMEFVKGDFINDFILKNKKDKKIIKSIIKDILEQMYKLDKLGITKHEMHHPIKHIIVKEDMTPVLVDFERCTKTDKPKNVTQFLQFVMGLNLVRKDKIMKFAEIYKKNPNVQNFQKIIELFTE